MEQFFIKLVSFKVGKKKIENNVHWMSHLNVHHDLCLECNSYHRLT
uniref:Uncharacterized protein n=1 Tax=Rhizophora mucronata TaxID=61149 RepID=A0A2P2R504_RHIMU